METKTELDAGESLVLGCAVWFAVAAGLAGMALIAVVMLLG